MCSVLLMERSYSDSFLSVQTCRRNSRRVKLLTRIMTILQLDRCIYPCSSFTCHPCVFSELRTNSMDSSSDGREIDKPHSPRSPGLHKHRHLEPPKTILDVDYKLLQSGVAILPGECVQDNYFPLSKRQYYRIETNWRRHF